MSRKSDKITIDQTLHGYHEGHTLISGSNTFDSADKRKLMVQSDLSGPNLSKGFDPYVTIYTLPSSKGFVFAKTWSAPEMPRPGCVWTQSLIISQKDSLILPDLAILNQFFVRPTTPDQFAKYSTKLNIELDYFPVTEPDFTTFHRQFLERLFAGNSSQLILLAEENKNIEQVLFDCWHLIWGSLRSSIELCSGLMGPRQPESGTLLAALAPQSIKRLLDRGQGISFIQSDQLTGQGMQAQDQKKLKLFSKFIDAFGADLISERNSPNVAFEIIDELYSSVENFDSFSKKIVFLAIDKNDNEFLSAILRRDLQTFPGLRSVASSELLNFIFFEATKKFQHFNFQFRELLSDVLEDTATSLAFFKELIREEYSTGISLEATQILFIDLAKKNKLEPGSKISDEFLGNIFKEHPELWFNLGALKLLGGRKDLIRSLLRKWNANESERSRYGYFLIEKIEGNAELLVELVNTLPFDLSLELVVKSYKINRSSNFLWKDFFEASKPLVFSEISKLEVCPYGLIADILESCSVDDPDAQNLLRTYLDHQINLNKLDDVPFEPFIFGLCGLFRKPERIVPAQLATYFQRSYQGLYSNQVSGYGKNLVEMSTVRPFLGNGQNFCGRIGLTLLGLLKSSFINAETFVLTCGHANLLDAVLAESENLKFSERRLAKRLLRDFLASPIYISAGNREVIERFVEEKWGW